MARPTHISRNQAAALRKMGVRSGLEGAIWQQLYQEAVQFGYETLTIPYQQPAKLKRYTPDFVLPNGIIVETKGRFITADRQKMLLIKEQYPDLDIRFVFSNSNNRISKQSKTTYAAWCEAKGFKYADKAIPSEWLREPRNAASLKTIYKLCER